jgi:hypothetical protein
MTLLVIRQADREKTKKWWFTGCAGIGSGRVSPEEEAEISEEARLDKIIESTGWNKPAWRHRTEDPPHQTPVGKDMPARRQCCTLRIDCRGL